MKQNKISVIIPTVGRDTLQKTLDGLNKQTRKPYEILVMNDKNKTGVSITRNKGILKSKGNLIALIDDDCIPPKDWLEKLEKNISPDVDFVGGYYKETDPFLNEIAKKNKEKNKDVKNRLPGTGGNILFKKSVLLYLQKKDGYMYDSNLITGEDWDLVWRLVKYGFKGKYVDVHPTHLKTVNLKKYLRMQYYRGLGIYGLSTLPEKKSHQSLVWSTNKLFRPFLIIWHTIIGPWKRFSKVKYTLWFWLGKKFEGLGYVVAWWKK